MNKIWTVDGNMIRNDLILEKSECQDDNNNPWVIFPSTDSYTLY